MARPREPFIGSLSGRLVLVGLWVSVALAIIINAKFGDSAWDTNVYVAAIHSLRAGHDPYADAMALQQAYHDKGGSVNGAGLPYSYVYSPITLPILRLTASLPLWFSGVGYWLVYILAVLGQLWAALQIATVTERRYLIYFAAASVYFPGLLENQAVLSGNVAYILYAVVLLAALAGWRRGQWLWFYLAVIVASCFKAPLLSLVAVAPLSARRQWVPAGFTAAGGIGLFAVQRILWPSLFAHFLRAVNLQFLYNRDFGCSPAGFLGDALFRRGLPYSPAWLIFYVCYAIPLFLVLLALSRRYFQGRMSLSHWAPVLLVGIVLLNPRIMEYDVAPLTLLLGLIAWRYLAAFTTRPILYVAVLFAATNGVAAFGWYVRKLVDGPLLVALFAAGCWMLWRQSAAESASSAVSMQPEVAHASIR